MHWFLMIIMIGVSEGFGQVILTESVEEVSPAVDVGLFSGVRMLSEEKREVPSFKGLEIYPQPAQDILFVGFTYSFGEEVRLELFDVLGRRVHAETLSGPRTAIDVFSLSRGVYFLSARTDSNQRVMRRVVID